MGLLCALRRARRKSGRIMMRVQYLELDFDAFDTINGYLKTASEYTLGVWKSDSRV